MIVYAVVFTAIARFQVPRYPIFLLAGLLPWSAFAASVTTSALSIVDNAHLVRRVRFPNEFLPLTAVIGNLVNLLPSFAVLLVFALIFGQPLGPPLLALPFLLLVQAVLTVGLALALSALTVYFRDIQHLVTIAITVWFFATPVIYPLSIFNGHDRLRTLLLLNPMTWLITGYQDVWHGNRWPDPTFVTLLTVIAGLAWLAGGIIFSRLQGRFAEEV